jgi:hypothetical protein
MSRPWAVVVSAQASPKERNPALLPVKVFREVASGAKTDRAQLRKAVTALEAGDVLMGDTA